MTTFIDLHSNPKAFPATEWHLINPVFLAEVFFFVCVLRITVCSGVSSVCVNGNSQPNMPVRDWPRKSTTSPSETLKLLLTAKTCSDGKLVWMNRNDPEISISISSKVSTLRQPAKQSNARSRHSSLYYVTIVHLLATGFNYTTAKTCFFYSKHPSAFFLIMDNTINIFHT